MDTDDVGASKHRVIKSWLSRVPSLGVLKYHPFIFFYIIPLLLATINYIFAPWVIARFTVKQFVIDSGQCLERSVNRTIEYSGWEITYTMHSLYSDIAGR